MTQRESQEGSNTLKIDLDNLAENLASLAFDESDDDKRRLSDEEISELINTTLVMRKSSSNESELSVTMEDFQFLMVIGRGSFGKVFLAEFKLNKMLYAIKSIRKDVLIEADQIKSAMREKDIMF